MKKKFVKAVVLLLSFIPCYVSAENITYDNAQNIVKEVMQAWYMRGSYIQYNVAKNIYYGINHPEDSTSQDIGYTVCSGLTNVVYQEAFGTGVEEKDTYDGKKIPTYASQYCNQTKDYITKNQCQTGDLKNGCNGEYAIYYEKNDNTYYFNTNENPTVEEFAQNIKPGDLFAYTGHVMIAYDTAINPKTNKLDVLLLQSGGSGSSSRQIKTKLDPTKYSTRLLSFANAPSSNTNNLLNINTQESLMPNEGTINNAKWLSTVTQFVKNGKITCSADECSVSRFFYKDENNNAKFNYVINEQQIKNSTIRTKLPGIFIHKTADSIDNNSVYPDQTITYTIKISNNSNMNKKLEETNYSKFYVTEIIPNETVQFINSNGEYNNGKITWTIDSLKSGQTTTLTYTVKVKNTNDIINKKINSEGTLYIDNTGSITTGVVTNTIIKNPAEKNNDYQTCYDKYKDNKKELELIDEVYKCAYDVDLKLSKFSINDEDNNMFTKLIEQVKNKNGAKTGVIKLINNDETKNYYDMILNDYWNSAVLLDTNNYYYLPHWTNNYRADTINKDDFKDGDVLIYLNDNTHTNSSLMYTSEKGAYDTIEQGIYAYIYLNGKFVGKNQSNDAERNEFTYEFYPESIREKQFISGNHSPDELTFANYQTLFGKDYYVILRPEKIIESNIKENEVKENILSIIVPDTKSNKSRITIIISLVIIITGLVIFSVKKRKKQG